MGLNFSALDFETANPSRSSACAVGLAKVRDGKVVDTFSTLVKPHVDVSEFGYFNMQVHKIRPEMVRSSPSWDAIHQDVLDFIGADTLIAHNAPFDRSVLAGVCGLYGIDNPENRYGCTQRLAEKMLDIDNYKLPTVARYFGIELLNHHEALDDAIAAAHIAVALSRYAGHDRIESLIDDFTPAFYGGSSFARGTRRG